MTTSSNPARTGSDRPEDPDSRPATPVSVDVEAENVRFRLAAGLTDYFQSVRCIPRVLDGLDLSRIDLDALDSELRRRGVVFTSSGHLYSVLERLSEALARGSSGPIALPDLPRVLDRPAPPRDPVPLGYYVYTRDADGDLVRPGSSWEVLVGEYPDEGGTYGEFKIREVVISGRSYVRLDCFDASWACLARHPDLLSGLVAALGLDRTGGTGTPSPGLDALLAALDSVGVRRLERARPAPPLPRPVADLIRAYVAAGVPVAAVDWDDLARLCAEAGYGAWCDAAALRRHAERLASPGWTGRA